MQKRNTMKRKEAWVLVSTSTSCEVAQSAGAVEYTDCFSAEG